MSESDSFINQVTEEVRRDKLYGWLRRYGWIGVVLVLALVGGAAWFEYQRAQNAAAAQQTGDALLLALAETDPAARAAAVAQVSASGSAVAVTALLTAATAQEAGDTDAARAALDTLAVNPDVPAIYTGLAAFKSALLQPDLAQRRTALESLAAPGQPFALLAQEQLALADLASGETEAAIERLRNIAQDAGVTRGLSDRANTLLVALGVDEPPSLVQN